MAHGKAPRLPVQPLLSLALLALFIWGAGKTAFFPSLKLLQDTPWDLSFFWPAWEQRFLSFLWIIPVVLGFWGWSCWFRRLFFPEVEERTGGLLGLSLALSFFSLFVFGLAVNGILDGPLTALFFAPALPEGWRARKRFSFPPLWDGNFLRPFFFVIPVLLWLFEILSPPLAWDAVLDHFRYAREVSRLHQIPFHWVNHTGDMPKAAELVLAGFWNLGGEPLSKLSLALPALLTLCLLGLFLREEGGSSQTGALVFLSCPFFLALYSFGYAEGFLAFFEVAALYCFWKGLQKPRVACWFHLAAFFLGMAFTVKYTAALAIGAVLILGIYWKWTRKAALGLHPAVVLFFLLPAVPWILKNAMAFGNPFYPLATSVFGTSFGYGPGMEKGLLEDTGIPWNAGFFEAGRTLWHCFFSASNGVNAALTPLLVMSLPWAREAFRKKTVLFVGGFCGLFFLGWVFISTSLRHASGGVVLLALLAAMAWENALRRKEGWGRALFHFGGALSFWICLSTQLTTTAPYASALGLEDPLLRLKRHYTYDTDTYAAYRFIENHSDPWDKVLAFAVWQTYPLQRTAFVDFKWKKPLFLEWASQCRTADQLAEKLREEGVVYFLYQQWEAKAMSNVEKDFELTGMPLSEYERFWGCFMEPVKYEDVPEGYPENTVLYRIREKPLVKPFPLGRLPGLEKD